MLQRIIDASGGAESWRFHEEEVMLDTYQNRYTNLFRAAFYGSNIESSG